MEEKRRSLAIAFFVLLGAVLAFVIGQHAGSALDRHGRSVTVAHDRTPAATVQAPPAQRVAAQK